ncbi:Lantibiotic dehydratase domain protein [Catenulispora acidiphila DSM 44928]|uniref:Lantibiotic dehydratase domain protein n=1 Tax=Catenulispora acidiphila (strain DSM 44928 / JCM 14897 / NBRC 102108 / NRRL B-24433 / ID139908) TaxID=479433 RepID=C7Q915_CATAD|nr:lantibiotic dehydratase [Catenulispora acidiphila]ACU72335.1 Lantibiotic dehydratase domain protein [Catenulispora acidiphila DSM 44928]
MTVPASDLRIPLGDTGWALWRDAAVRGTGFPARIVEDFCDSELAAAADAADGGAPEAREQYEKAFAAASDRLTAATRRLAADPAFREAVAWQNPDVVRNCLDRVAADGPRSRKNRKQEVVIASYLQRYCLKNDTIGFFGPFGWARFDAIDGSEGDSVGLIATPGPSLLSRRTAYFEDWAVSALADQLADRPDVWPRLRPRLAPAAAITGRTVRLPFRRAVTLTAAQARVIGLCDGARTVADLAGTPPDPAVAAALLQLRAAGVLRIDLAGALTARPEHDLAERIAALDDPAVCERAREPLDRLVTARDAVADAAGDADRVLAAASELSTVFHEITGVDATRRPGGVYAGRTLVYEDTVRDVGVRVGGRFVAALAPPLGIVLDSARWLAATVADRYEARARELFQTETERTGLTWMPMFQLLTTLMPEIARLAAGGAGAQIVAETSAELQARWRRVLGLSAEDFDRTARHGVTSSEISEAAAKEFAFAEPRLALAGMHCPDLMLSAADAEALARGDIDFTLGELHCAALTVQMRCFYEQNPAQDRLRAAAIAFGPPERMVIIPRLDTAQTTARMGRAVELVSPDSLFVSIGMESMEPPPGARVVSVLDLLVHDRDGELVVRHRDGSVEQPLLKAIADPLSALLTDAFQPFAAVRHRPRITIDRLTIARETWTFPAESLAWALQKDERRRYAAARRWRIESDLPERAFIRIPGERKPMALDFRSLPLVNLLARSIRRTAGEGGGGTVAVAEMLPKPERLWLRDAAGEGYTAELRLIAERPITEV